MKLRNLSNIINGQYESNEEIKVILDTINWDFKSFQTQYLTHKFHSYPGRFIPQISKTFIRLFTKATEDENLGKWYLSILSSRINRSIIFLGKSLEFCKMYFAEV